MLRHYGGVLSSTHQTGSVLGVALFGSFIGVLNRPERPHRPESLRAARRDALRAVRPAAHVDFCAASRVVLVLIFEYDSRHSKLPDSSPPEWRSASFARPLVRANRWLWNTALQIRCAAYRERGLTLTGSDLARWPMSWKRTAGHEWLALVPATCLTQCLRYQDAAFRNFFAGRARYPRFKRKSTAGSLRFQDVGRAWACGIVSLPKLGALKLAESLPEVERPDLVTLSRDAAGRYHVSFSAQVQTALLSIRQRSVGVDLGLTHLATLSTGEKILSPKRYHRTSDTCANSNGACPDGKKVVDGARSSGCGLRARTPG
jgi:hypothetical protein